MDITFIGCGDALSEQTELGNNSALLEFEGTNLLIDTPDSNYCRIKHIGKTYSDIENIFITHLHSDHISGLPRFADYRKFLTPLLKPNTPKPNLYVPEELYFGLWDSFKNGLGITYDGIKKLEDYFVVHLVKDKFTINGVTFYVTHSKHVPNMPVFGLWVRNLFHYSSDSTYQEEWTNLVLTEVNYLFHDMHLFPMKINVHASIDDFSHYPKEKKGEILWYAL